MNAIPTSAASHRRWPGGWRRWAAFVRQPVLPDRAELGLAGGLRALAPLLVLDVGIMGVLIGAVALAAKLGFPMPDHALDHLKLTPLILGLIMIAAPIMEETVFRGWLSGRPGHILAVILLAAGVAWMAVGKMTASGLSGLAAAAIGALAALWFLRKAPPLAWFQRHFAWFYWGSAIAFAAVHLTNFAAAGPAMLPFVLPQFIIALFLGYLRVRRGLWTSMLMHMAHNSIFIGLVLAGIN